MIRKNSGLRTFALLLFLISMATPPGALSQTFTNVYVPEEDADLSPPADAEALPIDGTAIKSGSGGLLLKGGATTTYTVPKGTPIKLQLASVPLDGGLKIIERDFDGNLPPAKMYQKITARTQEDIFVDDHNVIPEGTIFYGHVSKLIPPKHNGIKGDLQIEFSNLETPDGRFFKFNVEADNHQKASPKSIARAAGRDLAYAAGGAVVGTMVAYNITGMRTTIATKGLNLAVGAGTGAVMATCYALWKRGTPAVLEPGDKLNMSIDTDLLMPITTKPTVKKPLPKIEGLNIEIRKVKKRDDGINNTVLKVIMDVDNETDHRFTAANFYLEDGNGTMNPVSCFGDNIDEDEFNFEIEPHSTRNMVVYFNMTWPKLKHKLVVLDPLTRKRIHSEQLHL